MGGVIENGRRGKREKGGKKGRKKGRRGDSFRKLRGSGAEERSLANATRPPHLCHFANPPLCELLRRHDALTKKLSAKLEDTFCESQKASWGRM